MFGNSCGRHARSTTRAAPRTKRSLWSASKVVLLSSGSPRDFTAACRGDNITLVPGELQQLLANPFANTQFLTREHIRVSLQDGVRHVEARRLAKRRAQGQCV